MMLHAETLEIMNPVNNKKMIFNSKLDNYFNRLVEK